MNYVRTDNPDGSLLFTPVVTPAPVPVPVLPSLASYLATAPAPTDSTFHTRSTQWGNLWFQLAAIGPSTLIGVRHMVTPYPSLAGAGGAFAGQTFTMKGSDGVAVTLTIKDSWYSGRADLIVLRTTTPLPATITQMYLAPGTLATQLAPTGWKAWWLDQNNAQFGGLVGTSPASGTISPVPLIRLAAMVGVTAKTPIGGDSGSPVYVPIIHAGKPALMLAGLVEGYIGSDVRVVPVAGNLAEIQNCYAKMKLNDPTFTEQPNIANLIAYSHN